MHIDQETIDHNPLRVRDTGQVVAVARGGARPGGEVLALCTVTTPGLWRGEWYDAGCVVRVPVEEVGKYAEAVG